ncbi:MAG: CHASE domain-containing protein [Phycisphaerae bacterium]
MSLLAFAKTSAWEQQRIQTAFTRAAEDRVSALRRGVEINLHELESLGAFFVASQGVERAEFREFVQAFLSRRPGIQALEWIPRVLDPEREAYEEAARREGLLDFQITERASQGRMVRAGQRQEYFPVYYVEPYEGNEAAVGFDLASNPRRLKALNRSRDTGEVVATARITLVQETANQYGFLVFLPIYQKGAPADSIEDRRANLEGFALGVFRIGDMMEKALTYLGPGGIDIHLYDESASAGERFLYFHPSRTRTPPAAATGEEEPAARASLHHAAALDLPGRNWLVLCTPSPDYVAAGRTWQRWAVLAAGLLFTGLLASYLLLSMRRAARLMTTNERLAQEIAERQRAEEALRESESHLRAVVHGSKDAMIAIGADGLITLFNPAAESMFGRTAPEMLGQPLDCLMPEIYRERHRQYVKGYFTHGEPHGAIGKTVELPAARSNGQQFSIELSLSIGQRDSQRFALAVIRDITERKQAEETLRESNAAMVEALEREKRTSMQLESTMEQLEAATREARAATQAKSEFLANMSHEIRTPMTAILGFSETLLDPALSDSERLSAVQTIRRNGEYLLHIINDILDLSKIEAGKLEVERVVCSPARLVAEVVSLMCVRAESKGLALSAAHLGPIPETLRSDPTRLRQILVNLTGNAIKFTEQGGVRLVACLVEKDDGQPMMQFDVIDSGIGMAEEQVARLFQPFTQADSSTTRNFGGTGLGLMISKRLAEMLGGDITVQSQPGSGSTFRVTIATGPLAGVRMLDDPREALMGSDGAGRQSSSPVASDQPRLDCRILLAEDGPDNQRLISFFLRKSGAAVTIVENGRLAVDAAFEAEEKGQPFDVILMDMQMPQLDGYEATSLLRHKGYSRPVVALTAHAMRGDREKCVRAGCDGFLSKPIDRRKLLETVRASLSKDRVVGAADS